MLSACAAISCKTSSAVLLISRDKGGCRSQTQIKLHRAGQATGVCACLVCVQVCSFSYLHVSARFLHVCAHEKQKREWRCSAFILSFSIRPNKHMENNSLWLTCMTIQFLLILSQNDLFHFTLEHTFSHIIRVKVIRTRSYTYSFAERLLGPSPFFYKLCHQQVLKESW